MTTHVKVLGVLYVAFSAITLCAAIFLGLGIVAATGIVGQTASPEDAAVALPIIGLAGSTLVIFLVVISLPGLITGIGILKLQPWARIVGIVLAAINLINIPFGTVLGIYGLWVLLNKETETLFSGVPSGAVISKPYP
jgi:hypothetical protein